MDLYRKQFYHVNLTERMTNTSRMYVTKERYPKKAAYFWTFSKSLFLGEFCLSEQDFFGIGASHSF